MSYIRDILQENVGLHHVVLRADEIDFVSPPSLVNDCFTHVACNIYTVSFYNRISIHRYKVHM